MCGIAGFIADDDLLGQESTGVLAAMLRPLEVRGPDGQGQWAVHRPPWTIALGHRRLAILDLSRAAGQPMHRGALSVTYNGEIYNYLELRREMESLGHAFLTRSDTEVLLAAYQEWGEACLERLNGMFAFAVWDARRNVLFCARDRAGEKPFYYFADDRCLVFASEIKALLAFGAPVPCTANWRQVEAFLMKDYQTLDEETFFEGIRELLPGRKMSAGVENERIRLEIRPYWQIPVAPDTAERASPEELRGLLDDAVRLRLRSDVPVGTCLSGGIDSPSIAAAVVELNKAGEKTNFGYQGVHAFAPFPHTDERPYVARLARHLGIQVDWVEVTGAGCRDELDELVYRQETPFLGPSVYAQRCVFRRAGELGLKVMLDGQGADELFGGYDWAVPRAIAAMGRAIGWMRAWREARAFAGPRFPFWRLLAQTVACRARGRRGEFPDELRAALNASLANISLPALLRYADRNSMSFGVEARLPFLDHRVIEAAARLAPEDLIGGGQTKAILRRAMEDRLPAEILERKDKTAFAVPEGLWMQSQLRGAVREAVHAPLWRHFDMPGKAALLRNAMAETEGLSYNRRSWKVLCVSVWYNRFFG